MTIEVSFNPKENRLSIAANGDPVEVEELFRAISVGINRRCISSDNVYERSVKGLDRVATDVAQLINYNFRG